ncbi:membrane integrity-associated transporter subunit PqiC [Paraburkholderia sp. LEh10]|uniref:PqiC family protein n=1 Tax=Paraburkholderia sp. LEh10 TaxID=2821353 RepID=UPI001AEA3DEE|nr:PqiC family protein [Paraburkholderia sp. LEh10]MBP0595909.1 membrane integrity-associated transporter subunit PqiC [Paraburkholderia sp. LEh10]
MKQTMLARGACLCVVAVTLLAACSSPRSSFYTLTSDAALDSTGAPLPVSVVVGPVTIPELVDRPQFVTRVSRNEVRLNEFARWGEPLRSGVADVIAADLSRLLGSPRVSVSSQTVAGTEACRVRVDILQFDSMPGDAVAIDALWTVRVTGRTALLTGRSTVREQVQGTDDAALVAAHSRALASLSRDIAAAIRRSPPA